MTDELALARVPDACTLPTVEQPLRRAEFDGLFATTLAVERRNERHVRFQLAGDGDLAERIRDLAAREIECCWFFAFSVTPQPGGRVDFDIEVPAAHIDVLDALIGRAEQIRAGR